MSEELVDDRAAPSGNGDTATTTGAPRGGRARHRSARSTAPPSDRRAVAPTWGQRWRERRRDRVSRWDRPPPPKDWRYFVGMLGKVMIVTGLLMFGFVAYQLWGTGIETARAQNRLENTFEDKFAAAVQAREPDPGAPARPEPSMPAADPGTDPGTDGELDEVGSSSTVPDEEPATDTPTEPSTAPGIGGAMSDIVPGGIDLADDAVEQDVPVRPGEAFAKIDIDKIGIEGLYVVPGVRLDDLKKGPGHYPDTPLPGQLGNASLAGHRTTYGAPFFDLDQLESGDEIVVTMVTGDRYVYRVTTSEVVTAADYWVISTRDPTVAELTLTTCDPKYTARNRLVVHSVLVPELSSPVGVPEFYDLDADDESVTADEPTTTTEIPGDDPTVAAPSTDDVSDIAADETGAPSDELTVDAAGDVAGDGGDPDGAPAAAGADPGEPDSSSDTPAAIDPDTAEIDAFSEGWFHDRQAFPQIALWGSVLTLISVLGYQISKRTRHSSIGFLVGIFPFLVALYFFYQNVNRLLPPGL